MMKITNYPDKPTSPYAQLWSIDRFLLEGHAYQSWPAFDLMAEDKGDERGIGAQYKIDIPFPCWVMWEGTEIIDDHKYRCLILVRGDPFGDSPGAAFLPVCPCVNKLDFGVTPPEPPEEEPPPAPEDPEVPEPPEEPEPPAMPKKLRSVTFFGRNTSMPAVVFWGERELVYSVPYAWIDDVFEYATKLFELVKEAQSDA